jgi:hypothetical protein
MSESSIFNVYGCYGTLTVEADTGNVLEYEPDSPNEPEYANIARVDIATCETSLKRRIYQGEYLSIMDFNFWSHDGRYFELNYSSIQSDVGDCDLSEPTIVLSRRDG